MNNILTTANGNNYLYNAQKNTTVFIHPLVKLFFDKEAEGVDIRGWLDNLEDADTAIEGMGVSGKKEILYYYQKFLFLKGNKFLNGGDDADSGKSFQRRLRKEEIENLVTGCREIIFEVTKACNLDCRYCIQGEFYRLHDKHQQKDMDVKKAKLLLKFLEDYWSRSLSSDSIGIKFYGGEPLVNMAAIREIVDYTKTLTRINNKFYYYVTTNGVLLEKHLDYLTANNFYISISLDGDEENNSYRVFKDGKPSFEKINQNIALIRDNYPLYFKENVSFQSVLHDRNSISELDGYFGDTYGKQPVMAELTRVGVKKERRGDFNKVYAGTYTNLYYGKDYPLLGKKKLRELPKIPESGLGGVIVHDIYNWLLKDSGDTAKGRTNATPTGTCHPFSSRMFLSTDGRILPCERIQHKYALGYVGERVSLDFQEVADTFNRYYDNMMQLCRSCASAAFCKKCMFSCKVEKPVPQCNLYFGRDEFLRKLAENIRYVEDRPEIYFKHITEI